MSASSLLSRIKSPFSASLQESTSFQKVAKSYRALRERDQWALKILSVFLLLVAAHTLVIAPAQNYAYKWRDAAGRNDHTLQWMRDGRASVESSSSSASVNTGDQSILAIASSSAKSNGLSFKRYEPVEQSSVRVWLEGVDFNSSVRWIEALHAQSGIAVRELQLERVSGAVNMNLMLQLE